MSADEIEAGPARRRVEDLRQAAVANGAPEHSAEAIAAAVKPVVDGLPQGAGRPHFGVEPAHFIVRQPHRHAQLAQVAVGAGDFDGLRGHAGIRVNVLGTMRANRGRILGHRDVQGLSP